MVQMQTVESEAPQVVQAESEACAHCGYLQRQYDDLLGVYKKTEKEASDMRIQLRIPSTRLSQEVLEKNTLLQKENDGLLSRISKMKIEQESLRQQCGSLEEVIQQLRSQVAQAPNHKDESANIAKERVEQPNIVRIRTGQLRRRNSDNPIEALIQLTQVYLDPTIEGKAKENNWLVTQIANMTDLNPKYPESYYSEQFNEINDDIAKWVVNLVGNIPTGTLSTAYGKRETRYTSLVSRVKDLDKIAGKFLETQKAELLSDPENRQKYRALIRHVITIFLYSQVFRLFMFGVESEGFNRLENDICVPERELSVVQKVHQCVGLEAMKYRTAKELGARKKVITTILFSLLQNLLAPARFRDAVLKSFAVAIVDKAVKLRDQMTAELEVYRCKLPRSGDLFNEDLHQLRNESRESGGDIQLCTFPGLTRLTTLDLPSQRLFDTYVVKASVIRDIEWQVWGGH